MKSSIELTDQVLSELGRMEQIVNRLLKHDPHSLNLRELDAGIEVSNALMQTLRDRLTDTAQRLEQLEALHKQMQETARK